MKSLIQVDKVVYNRNGVCGYPFYTVSFVETNPAPSPMGIFRYIAIVDASNTDKEGKTVFDLNKVYIITPDNISDCWRGTYFAADVIKAIKKSEKK